MARTPDKPLSPQELRSSIEKRNSLHYGNMISHINAMLKNEWDGVESPVKIAIAHQIPYTVEQKLREAYLAEGWTAMSFESRTQANEFFTMLKAPYQEKEIK